MMTRVLIADDDPRITEIHQHYVKKVEGFEVIGLSNTLERHGGDTFGPGIPTMVVYPEPSD